MALDKMLDLIRDAPVGQIIRYVTGNKVLLYPEEKVRKDYDSGDGEDITVEASFLLSSTQ